MQRVGDVVGGVQRGSLSQPSWLGDKGCAGPEDVGVGRVGSERGDRPSMAASKGQGPRTGRAREPGGLVVPLKGLQKGRNLTAGLLAEGLSAERRLVQARGKCGRARLPLAAVPLSALSPSGTEFLSWAYSFQGSLLHRMRSCEVGEGD